jgi:hypothetical protein
LLWTLLPNYLKFEMEFNFPILSFFLIFNCYYFIGFELGQAFCMCPKGWLLDTDWKTCVDIDECKEQETLKPEDRCNYECINTPGSYKCRDHDVGADQPFYYDNNNDYIKLKIDDDEKAQDESSDFGVETPAVSICLNGFYYNETIGDCLGKLF